MFKYDENGIRIQKIVNGVQTDFITSGIKLLGQKTGENVLLWQVDGNGNTIGFNYNNIPYFYMKNLQVDIIGLTNASGNVVAKYTYDFWGKLISIKDASDVDKTTDTTFIGYINPLRYRGYYYDSETGLYYLNARYYDPEVGRFINADETLVGGYNIFAYCSNNPINFCDISGNVISIDFFRAVINGDEYRKFIHDCFTAHVEGGFAIYSLNGQYSLGNITLSTSVNSWDGPNPAEIWSNLMKGYTLEGILHVHPFDETLGSIYDGFSQKDVNAAHYFNVPIYAYTAAGELLGYDPRDLSHAQMVGLPYIDPSLVSYLSRTYGPVMDIMDFRRKEALFRSMFNGVSRGSPYIYQPETWAHFVF